MEVFHMQDFYVEAFERMCASCNRMTSIDS